MAKWTLKHIADAILNDVTDGSQGSPNTPISEEQIKGEVILYRNALIEDMAMKKTPCQETKAAEQQINCITVKDGELSDCCEGTLDEFVYYGLIPEVLTIKGSPAISFIGDTSRRSLSWQIHDNDSYNLRGYRVGVKSRPYVVLTPASNGFHKAFILNPPLNLYRISVTGIFADPLAKYDYSCCSISGDPEELAAFPASDAVIQRILETLTQKYMNYYRNGNAPIQNNDQTDKVT